MDHGRICRQRHGTPRLSTTAGSPRGPCNRDLLHRTGHGRRHRSFRILSDDPSSPRNGVDDPKEDRHLDYIVRGIAHFHEERLQITLQLHSLRESRLVWGEKFGGPLQELFRIQEEIVEKIVTSLQSSVDHDLLAEIRKKPITGLNAYEC